MTFSVRKLLFLGGGAAIMATAGFAYMASNTVATSSAGEGSGAVTGYHVSNISTTVNNVFYESDPSYSGDEGPGFDAVGITAVSFQLTPDTAGGAPTNVDVYPVATDGAHHWGHDNGCSATSSWNTSTGGTYKCNIAPTVPVEDLGSWDVEANQ